MHAAEIHAPMTGEVELEAIRPDLTALPEQNLLPHPLDARRGALAALLLARQVEPLRDGLRHLEDLGRFDTGWVGDLQTISRATLHILACHRRATGLERTALRETLRRAWTLLVPIYQLVREAAREVARDDAHKIFPSLPCMPHVTQPSRIVAARPPKENSRMEPTTDIQVRAASPALDGRQHRRLDAELEVTLVSDTNFYMGFTENISEGGVFVATHQLQPVGTTIELCLSLPDGGENVTVVGVVRWVRLYSPASDAPPGMGIQFQNLPQAHIERIRAFVARRDPLFYDD